MLRLSILALCLSGILGQQSTPRGLATVEMPEGATVCETKQQCRQKFREMNTGGSFSFGNGYPYKGCFRKNNNVYFGTGGTDAEISEYDLPGIIGRIWCDPTAAPSKRPTVNPSASPVTSEPSGSPTNKPVTDQPTTAPSAAPSISPSNKPTPQPSASPSMKPTSTPTAKPVTKSPSLSPTKSPSPKPVTSSPSSQPARPVTSSPTIPVILAEIGTSSPTAIAREEPATTDSPSKQTAQSPVTSSPTKNPVTERPSTLPIAAVVSTESPSKSPTIVTDSQANSPSKMPSMQPVVTDSPTRIPTRSPSLKPVLLLEIVTDKPSPESTASPSAHSIVTANPTTLPTISPSLRSVTSEATAGPTASPSTAEPSKGASVSPSQSPSKGPSVSPSQSPSHKPVTASPTTPPTEAPVTVDPSSSPSAAPTSSPSPPRSDLLEIDFTAPLPDDISLASTSGPTASPAGTIPSDSLEIDFTAPLLDDISPASPSGPTASPAGTIPSDSLEIDFTAPLLDDIAPASTSGPTASPAGTTGRDGNPGSWSSRSMTPFTLTLQTQSDLVDTDELNSILSDHLRDEISRQYDDVTQVRLNIAARRRHLQDGLAFSSDPRDASGSSALAQHNFEVSGQAYFASTSTPTTAELDRGVKESFEGEKGDRFVSALQSAEDAGLQTTISVGAAIVEADVELSENYLGTVAEGEGEDPIVGQPLYVLGIVFGIGCLLIALYVFKTHRGRRIARENDDMIAAMEEVDEESVEVTALPKYIEVENENGSNESGNEEVVAANNEPQYDQSCTFYGSIRDAMTSEPSALTSVGVEEKAVRLGLNPDNTQRNTRESQVGNTDGTPSRVEFRTRTSTQKSAAASESSDPQTIKTSLASISEGASKNREDTTQWALCGGLDPLQNNVQRDVEWGEKPSSARAAGDDEIVCCGPAEEDLAVEYERSDPAPGTVTTSQWGQKPLVDDDFDDSRSLQTSRVSNTSGNKGS